MKDPFANAIVKHYANSRRHAETAVTTALLICEACQPTAQQLADLADAVDALRAGQYRAATILAEAAIEGRRCMIREAIRPTNMARSIPEIRAMLLAVQAGGQV